MALFLRALKLAKNKSLENRLLCKGPEVIQEPLLIIYIKIILLVCPSVCLSEVWTQSGSEALDYG